MAPPTRKTVLDLRYPQALSDFFYNFRAIFVGLFRTK